ncbi:hypothetical protein [Exiguobacterium artemiae]
MNMTQIESALQDIFDEPLNNGEKRKLVFWVDKDKEFTEEIGQLALSNVKVQTLSDRNSFYIKHLLEEEDPTSFYLIYTNLELGVEDNWLVDTVLYSKIFFADRISLILNELQIDFSLRAIIKKTNDFLTIKNVSVNFSHLLSSLTRKKRLNWRL